MSSFTCGKIQYQGLIRVPHIKTKKVEMHCMFYSADMVSVDFIIYLQKLVEPMTMMMS